MRKYLEISYNIDDSYDGYGHGNCDGECNNSTSMIVMITTRINMVVMFMMVIALMSIL